MGIIIGIQQILGGVSTDYWCYPENTKSDPPNPLPKSDAQTLNPQHLIWVRREQGNIFYRDHIGITFPSFPQTPSNLIR